MHFEVTIGLNFIRSYLYDKLPRRRVNMFGEELEKQIKMKFLNHWHTDKTYKDSGYRCLKLTSDHIDPVFIKAAQDSGLELQEIVKNLPQYFILWIDPGEISYRLVEKGPVRILYEEDTRLKLRHKKLENLKDTLVQNKALNYRKHHHHHNQMCIDKFSNLYNNESSLDAKFLVHDDDTFSDLRFDAYTEECSCYFDFEFTYENDTNNINATATPTSMMSAISTPSLLSNAFSTNDLNLLQFQHSTLNLSASEPLHHQQQHQQQQHNQFNPDAETFKPMLMNSQSGTSLANSKAYKSNIFSSTHNISKSFAPFGPSTANTNLPSLQPSFSIQSLSQQNNYSQQQQQQQLLQNQLQLQQQAQQLTQQIQSQQQQQKQRANMQRLLNTSIDSLNSTFNSLSLASPSLMNLSLSNNSNSNHNSSLWCLPSSSVSPNNNNNNNNTIFLPATSPPATTTTTANIIINDVTTPASSLSPLLSPGAGTSNTAALIKSTTVVANPTFTAHSFANTKFGSTKTKSTNRRPQKMLPSEFSAYIKQKAQIQQLQKSPQITSKPPFGISSTASTTHQQQKQQQNSNFQSNTSGGIIGYNNQYTRQNLVTPKSPGPNTSLLAERSFSNTVGDNISPPLRSISLSNALGTNDLFNFDFNSFDAPPPPPLADHNSLLSPQPYQQQSLNNCSNDFGLLINNNNTQNYGICTSSSSSDSSSVGSSFLSDSKSPPLQLTTSSSLSATSSKLLITTPPAINPKHSFSNSFSKSSNDSSLNFYNSNQTNSNVSPNNSLVAGFANIAATQQIQTNHSNNIYNNKYNNNNNNNEVFNNFLRYNRIHARNGQGKFKSTPSRPNSLFLHLQYDTNKDSFENTNCFNEDDDDDDDDDDRYGSGYGSVEPSDDDDMPKYFNPYDNVIECVLEPEIEKSSNNSHDFDTIYNDPSSLNVGSSSLKNKPNDSTQASTTEVTTNSASFQLLMAN